MKKLSYLIVLTLILGLVLTGCLLSNVGQVPTTEQSGISTIVKSNGSVPIIKNYGDVPLSGGFQAGHFSEVWDLYACDMVISFTYDANGLVDDFGGDAHAWAELGIREVGYGDFNPTWMVEGAGVWLATDYDWNVDTFDPDPPGSPTLDLDDKLILQKAGGHGEGDYNLPSAPPNPQANHRVWWDRDGVDPWQNDETANTGGIYNIKITLTATSTTAGEAYMEINTLDQGFETDGNWNTIELTPAGMTFTGDMTQMQVFYGLYGSGAIHDVEFRDIAVQGCLAPIVIETITINPAALGTMTELTAEFTGPIVCNYTATINWGDGYEEIVYVSDGSGIVNGLHEYDNTGVFTVMLTIESDCGAPPSGTESQYAVVYDPSAGFVTGGGWIDSPAGAFAQDLSLEGKASFGFVSKYKKGQSTPTGNTEFQFKAGNLNFHSDSYDWLVIAGHKAMYKGIGTINGDGNFGFMISAIDEKLTPNTAVDMFRIKIWDKNNGDALVYDNNSGEDDDADPATGIAGGQIVIHKKQKHQRQKQGTVRIRDRFSFDLVKKPDLIQVAMEYYQHGYILSLAFKE